MRYIIKVEELHLIAVFPAVYYKIAEWLLRNKWLERTNDPEFYHTVH
jgi:hypothetical protein